ncbi:MAG: hypothetical protein V3T32_06740, partial [Thermodesulfobacteriota bacterium]
TKGAKALKGLSEGFKKFGAAVVKLKLPILAAAASILALGVAAGKLAIEASKFKEVQTAFSNMAAKQGQDSREMLANMRKLSGGTVSDLELMKQANTALLLGLPVEKFGDMLNIARSSAKATGASMQFMLQSIVTGLGRGSKLILDNLGIVFDVNKAYEEYAKTLGRTASQLTEAEKKQAFINKALSIGLENAKAAGKGGDSLSDKWQKLTATASNLAIIIGNVLGPSYIGFIDLTQKLLDVTKEFFSTLQGDKSLDGLKQKLTNLTALGDKARKALDAALGSGNEAAARARFESIQRNIEATELELDTAIKAEQKKKGLIQAGKDAKKLSDEEEAEERRKFQEIRNEEAILSEEELNIAILDEKIAANDKELSEEENKEKRLELLRKKRKLNKDKEDAEDRKRIQGLLKFEKLLDSQKVKDKEAVFGRIATLQSSSNKKLFRIGQSAAIGLAIVDTARGITLALRSFPPPFNFVFASLVGAAGAVQIAKIASAPAPLEHGGIVPATTGGTLATIGEGGRDEAVVPLEEGGAGLGTTIVINVGAFLGDQEDAREFAVMIDEQLLGLRQNNESAAFDEGIV